jgi:hypothetical protein
MPVMQDINVLERRSVNYKRISIKTVLMDASRELPGYLLLFLMQGLTALSAGC